MKVIRADVIKALKLLTQRDEDAIQQYIKQKALDNGISEDELLARFY